MNETKTKPQASGYTLVKALKKYTLYIGSNNETKVLNVPYAVDIIAVRYHGFTYDIVKGYWRGDLEDTLRVEIATTDGKEVMDKMCAELKQLLKQDAIMLTISNDIITFE